MAREVQDLLKLTPLLMREKVGHDGQNVDKRIFNAAILPPQFDHPK